MRRPARAPSAAWYGQLARAMQAAYVERLAGLGEAEPKAAETCTTHLTACDRDGMMVAMTTTLLSSMGSRWCCRGSGVLMNNGVMWFDPTPGDAQRHRPGQASADQHVARSSCADGDQPEIAGGASGGRRIMAAVFQLLAFVSDFGMDAGGGGASPADRRLRPRGRHRRPAAAARGAGRPAPMCRRWWSMRSCR